MHEKDIEIMLRDNLPDAEVSVHSDDGTHYEAIVITDIFKDKKLVERHRIVYAIVGAHITSGIIHALGLKHLPSRSGKKNAAISYYRWATIVW